ncbi:hypothetical protein SNOG_02623 [Parastagonospora nodorum SN15]|uniref:Uncharacterized protein n=1 Tax=Phaeosphaeria nodorum (strain SN15 / ATCC MYA-4574 / FGSC 10173) TaxID=321614 RepID=Q0V041_PHANO|nr:hypothetical protein SNOG_02623 [Parastagonospora nodorum SN15]EAT89354.1 hypothetical protein SNOG_02623 [Parastagonospora nodorum SN15]
MRSPLSSSTRTLPAMGIAEELARQIDSVGGDPALANEASTFAPGEIGDETGAGNTCNVLDDEAGCINSQNLRVDDLSAAEIEAAVAGGAGGAAVDNAAAAGNATAVAPEAKGKGKAKANKGKNAVAADASADALQQIQAIACAA